MSLIISILIAAWCMMVMLGLFSSLEEKKRLGSLLRDVGYNETEDNGGNADNKRFILEIAQKMRLSQAVLNYFHQAGVMLRIEEVVTIGLTIVTLVSYLVLTGKLLAAVALVIMAMLLPAVWLSGVRRKRVRQFNSQLGEALVLMANSMRAGFSFLQSMSLISKEAPMPLSAEFAIVLKEMQLGVPTEQALPGMLSRVASEDLEMMVTAVLIQRQVGGNLAEVLDAIAATIQERVRIKGEIKTLTAQGRISGLIIGLLPMVLALVLAMINPEYISVLITDPVGPMLIGYGIISQLLGAAMIRKIVSLS